MVSNKKSNDFKKNGKFVWWGQHESKRTRSRSRTDPKTLPG